jgi:hypothetical protein
VSLSRFERYLILSINMMKDRAQPQLRVSVRQALTDMWLAKVTRDVDAWMHQCYENNNELRNG